MGYEDQSHTELGEMLKERGLDVPKTKEERIAALMRPMHPHHFCIGFKIDFRGPLFLSSRW